MELSEQQLKDILSDCLSCPSETEWLEFKLNNYEFNQVGKRVSAISNSACLNNKEHGFLIFGIEDETHNIIGTDFCPETEKAWSEPYLFKLSKNLNPDTSIPVFKTFQLEEKTIVMVIIPAAVDRPTSFQGIPYIRIDSATPKLWDYPDKERKIWNNVYNKNFEKQIAISWLLEQDIFDYLETDKILELLGIGTLQDPSEILRYLQQYKIIKKSLSRFEISNLGAILFAKKLSSFDSLKTKWLRVVVYDGNNKSANHKSFDGEKWYALWFEEALKYISLLAPRFEQVVDWRREQVQNYPAIAIREFLANALIHQDLSISGTSPIVEIYRNRIEISNPWIPLIDVDRFIDNWLARNEDLSDLMRKMKFCEKLWSWIDKAIITIEAFKLPAPKIETTENTTKITLFLWEDIWALTKEDRIRACYHHCALKYIHNEFMTNASLRDRLNMPDTQTSSVSRIINEAIDVGKIKVFDPENKSPKHNKYIPFWA